MAIKGFQVLIFEWCMIGYTLFLVYLRLHTRLSRSSESRPLNVTSDIFVVLAWLSFLLHAGFTTVIWKTGFIEWEIDPASPAITPEYTELAMKMFYVEGITYYNVVYAVKFSMLSLFMEFFPLYMVKTRRFVVISYWLTLVSWISQFLLATLWCLPVKRNWSLDASFCTPSTSITVVVLSTGPHFLTDLIIYSLPFPVIYQLGLPRRQKIGLSITFAAGFLCIVFGVLLLASIYFSGRTPLIWIMSILEQTNALVVVCSPAVKSWAVDGKRMDIFPWRWRRASSEPCVDPTRDPEVGVLVVEMRSDVQRHTSNGRSHNYSKAGRESIGMVSTISDSKSLSL